MENMKYRGFTLIELLVVIAIISILSATILTTLSSARVNAVDSAKLKTLLQIQKALELYNIDNGQYPEHPALVGVSNFNNNASNSSALSFEADLSPYIDLDISEEYGEYWTAGEDYFFKYASFSSDNFQSYVLALYPLGDRTLSSNDGGYQDTAIELGEVARYCMSKYTGTDAYWWHTSKTQRCVGGD